MSDEPLSITLTGDAAAKLRKLSEASGHSVSAYLAVMLDEHFEFEMSEIETLQKRVESAEAGKTVAHDDAREVLRRAIAKASRDAAE